MDGDENNLPAETEADGEVQRPEEENKERADGTYMAYGMCAGLGVGVVFGVLFDNLAIGMCFGMCIGMTIGIGIKRK